MSKIIEKIEQEQLREVSDFHTGDTIAVHVRVVEGNRERIQIFEGVVIARRNRGFNSSYTVRKISNGVGVERVFPLHTPLIEKVVVKRKGDVRRAKLYNLRNLSGKAARIKEKLVKKGDKVAAVAGKAKAAPAKPAADSAAPQAE